MKTLLIVIAALLLNSCAFIDSTFEFIEIFEDEPKAKEITITTDQGKTYKVIEQPNNQEK